MNPEHRSGVGSHTALGQGPEFDRIRAIWRRLGDRAAAAGDDCALVVLAGEQFAIGTDLAVEDAHFRAGWLQPDEIGWRAGAAGLSDLAAMAAEPLGLLVSVGVSDEWPEELVTDVLGGIADAATSVGAMVWGGDLVRSDKLIVDVVVVGKAARPVRRAGAQAGDALCVSGRLGAPAAAIAAWGRGMEPDHLARERFAHPIPRIAEALWLRDRGARAMLDVSDGLAADAGHLAAASAVRCVIDSDRVPVHPAAETPGRALVSGEEYELLVALPGDATAALGREFESRFGVPLTRVGSIESGSGVEVVREGKAIDVPAGFRHF
jgi:thiamine-monophosphate kinase